MLFSYPTKVSSLVDWGFMSVSNEGEIQIKAIKLILWYTDNNGICLFLHYYIDTSR